MDENTLSAFTFILTVDPPPNHRSFTSRVLPSGASLNTPNILAATGGLFLPERKRPERRKLLHSRMAASKNSSACRGLPLCRRTKVAACGTGSWLYAARQSPRLCVSFRWALLIFQRAQLSAHFLALFLSRLLGSIGRMFLRILLGIFLCSKGLANIVVHCIAQGHVVAHERGARVNWGKGQQNRFALCAHGFHTVRGKGVAAQKQHSTTKM